MNCLLLLPVSLRPRRWLSKHTATYFGASNYAKASAPYITAFDVAVSIENAWARVQSIADLSW